MPDSPHHPEAVAVDLEEGERLVMAVKQQGGMEEAPNDTKDALRRWLTSNSETLLASVREARDEAESAASKYQEHLLAQVRDALEEAEQAQKREDWLRRVKEVASDSRYSDEFVGNLFRAALSHLQKKGTDG